MGRYEKGLGSHWILARQKRALPLLREATRKEGKGIGVDFEKRRRDFFQWCTYYFPDIFIHDPPPHQREWMEMQNLHRDERGQKFWTTAFRGSSKSTIWAILAPLYRICEGLETYIVWIGATEEQAYSRRQSVMDMLESNELLRQDYGELVPQIGEGKPWSRKKAVTRSGIYLESYGVTSTPRGLLRSGHRPSLIIMDDMNSEKNQSTVLQRAKLVGIMDDLILRLGAPDGSCNYWGISTPQHSEGIESQIKTRATWKYREYPGVTGEARNRELWDKWRWIYLDLRLGDDRKAKAEEFFLIHKEEMLAGASTAWPEMATYYDYYIERTEKPASFTKEIGLPLPIGLCPIDLENQKLPTDDCSLFRIKGNNIHITRGPRQGDIVSLDDCLDYGFLDPAVGEKPTGDFASIARISVDPYGYKYVTEIFCKVADKGMYLRAYLDMHKRRPFQIAGFEANGFQAYLKDEWEKIEAEEYKRGTKIPMYKVKNTGKKLPRMVSALQTPMINHHLAFNEFIVYSKPEVWTQFINLGTSDHDDAPDALASCLAMQVKYG
jgi:hypothetical protein